MIEWMKTHGPELALASAIMLVMGVVAVPWIILRLPKNALHRRNPLDVLGERHHVLRVTLFIVRNVVALPLFVLGVIMVVAPGQGILTIVLSLVLADFPGKFRIERRLLSAKPIVRALNWIRRKGHREEFEPPPT
jgi:hypothetical protein